LPSSPAGSPLDYYALVAPVCFPIHVQFLSLLISCTRLYLLCAILILFLSSNVLAAPESEFLGLLSKSAKLTQGKVHPFLEQHELALEKAQRAVAKHEKLAKDYHPHDTAGRQHRQILDKLNRIVRYHEYRIDKIKKGHANRDPYESMRIKVSTKISKDCADMDQHAMRTWLSLDDAVKMPFFSKNPKEPTEREKLRKEALFHMTSSA